MESLKLSELRDLIDTAIEKYGDLPVIAGPEVPESWWYDRVGSYDFAGFTQTGKTGLGEVTGRYEEDKALATHVVLTLYKS